MRRARLPWRIVASAVVSVVLAVGLLVLGVFLARPTIRDATVQSLMSTVDLEECAASPETWGARAGTLTIHAYAPDGRSSNPDAPPLEPNLREGALREGHLVREGGEPTVAVVPMAPSGPCALVRLRFHPPGPAAFDSVVGVLGLATVAGMLLAGAGTFWFVVLPLRQRVEELSEAAGGVGGDGFVAPDQADDALGHIAEVLASSHARIVETRTALEQRNRALQEHLAGIAHDLRTPLSSMQLALEAMAGEAEGGLQREARRALADVVYLAALVDNLHQGARLRHDVDVSDGVVDLVDLAARLERRFAIVGRHADVEVGALLPDGEVRVACAPALAERAIANLVQNAVEHHRGAGNVAILLTATEDRFELCVEDDGPGLPPEVRASLEAEGLLTDEARPRGPGLGMLITAEIARRAGWTLTYEALEPTGVRARLTGQLERR
ncbi:MAG: HAMP domain-containing histidine kinase [Alphaproteobacteria bacterium]|nr:HAMP domain-containing histidine kinase [Alphaproteobacteria bacterium]